MASTDSADQDADVADATHTVQDRSPMEASHTHLSSDEESPSDDVITPSARGLEQLYGTTQHRQRRTLDVENNEKDMGEGGGRGRRGRGRRGMGARRRRGMGTRGRWGRGSRGRSGRSGVSTANSAIQCHARTSFIGPLTLQETIFSSEWKREESSNLLHTFSGPPPGPVRPIDNSTQAVDLFLRFFPDEAIHLVVEETNRYAAQCRAQCTSPTPCAWHNITRDELKAFFGLLFYMGIARLPQLELYWSTKHDLIRQNISDIMLLVRFQQILRFFHLNNSQDQICAGQPGYDPLFKVRRLVDIVTSKFEQEYNLSESISVDEAMIPFKGRLSFKQYMRDKPVKHGIKVFVLADGKYGYIKRMQIYTGKNSTLSQNELGLSTKVVLDLTKGLGTNYM